MTRTRNYAFAGLAVAAGIGAGVIAAPYMHVHSPGPGVLVPQWANNYQSLSAMSREVDAVVLAVVEDTRPGRTIFTSGGQNALPFTLVDLAVERVIRGEAEEFITLEQTGGTFDDAAFYVDGDGGEYEVGGRVLLFLNQQPETDYYYLAHPQGRFAVQDDELYAVAPDGPAARSLDRRNVQGAIRLIETAE